LTLDAFFAGELDLVIEFAPTEGGIEVRLAQGRGAFFARLDSGPGLGRELPGDAAVGAGLNLAGYSQIDDPVNLVGSAPVFGGFPFESRLDEFDGAADDLVLQLLLYTYAFFVRPANQLCFGRLAYRGYLFGLDESLTEKAKRGFVFRMRCYGEHLITGGSFFVSAAVMMETVLISAPHEHKRGSTSKIFLNKRAQLRRVSRANSESAPAERDGAAWSEFTCAALAVTLARLQ